MSMNRQTRRLLQKQGEVDAEGAPVATRERTARRTPPPRDRRTSPREFVKEVRGELRKVVWPTRSELINYSIVVLIAIVVLTAIIGGLDWLFGEAVIHLYDTN
jgi:preprotein translocase subunit SecE